MSSEKHFLPMKTEAGSWIKGTFIPAYQQNIQEQDLANYEKWCSLYPQWPVLTKKEKKRIKKMKNKDFVDKVLEGVKKAVDKRNSTLLFAEFSTVEGCDCRLCNENRRKKEQEMNYAYAQIAAPVDADKQKVNYLTERLNAILNKKYEDLREQFNFNWDRGPRNPKELVEMIEAGDYWFPKYNAEYWDDEIDEEELGTRGHPFFDIRWGKKGTKPDTKGFDAAEKKLNEAYQTAKDGIIISSPEKGLEILREFESATLH